MESSQLYAATLTHYSTEPLTTGPDYEPLFLLLALAGDLHPNPGLSRYPYSVCFKHVTSQGTSYLCTQCSHWVHSICSGLQNTVDYRRANGNDWICTTCMTLPQPRTPSPPPSPAHMPTMIKLRSRHLPTDCQKHKKLFRATLLKTSSHHIPTGKRKLYTQHVPAEILAMMEERDDLRKQDPASPRLSTINDEISNATPDHKRRQ